MHAPSVLLATLPSCVQPVALSLDGHVIYYDPFVDGQIIVSFDHTTREAAGDLIEKLCMRLPGNVAKLDVSHANGAAA